MPDNKLLAELKARIADDSVVIIAGSAVSVLATGNAPAASWQGLLREGIQYSLQLGTITPAVADLMRQQVDSGDLDLLRGVANTIRPKIGSGFRAWLQKTSGALRPKAPEVIEALRALNVTLATTNYDHLLGTPAIPWTDEASVEEVLRELRPGVIHLHGDFAHPSSVILDRRSYDQTIDSGAAIIAAIRTLKTLVFVGYDLDFATSFRWTEGALADSPFDHFVLCRNKDVAALRRKHPAEQKLHPLPYGDVYEDLPAFLRSLAPPQHSTRYLFGSLDDSIAYNPFLERPTPVRLFVSYAHDDEPQLKRLDLVLGILERHHGLTSWRDKRLIAGDQWNEVIRKRLEEMDIFLFIASQSSLVRPYLRDPEIRRARERSESGEVEIVTVKLEPCACDDDPFIGKFQRLGPSNKSVAEAHLRSEAWEQIRKDLVPVIERVRERKRKP